jgi:hypothetical protein
MEDKEEPFTLEIIDGIQFGKYNVDHIDLVIAKRAFELRLKKSDGKLYPALADMRGFVSFDKEATEFLASKEAYSNVTALALVVNSVFQKMAGTFFIFLNKPPVPAKVFTDHESAIKWLNQYKNIV